MGKPTGFMEYTRQDVRHREIDERLKDYGEINLPHPEETLVRQAARCMDCGIPFCHAAGCPVRNRIPEFNDLIYRGKWREACENLHSTNNFPEFTGRICPAPCEASCTLNINDDPVLIEHIEYAIAERGWQEGWIVPQPAAVRTGKKVAVVGSGPAGLAAAQQLARAGHDVVVFEKDEAIGGLLRMGIPDFKLNKGIIERRVNQLRAEGVRFQTGVIVGDDISARYLRKLFDAVVLTMGAGRPRDLDVPGRQADNVHFAMDFLTQQNRRVSGLELKADPILARDKIVVVIGGGDTGSDCVGTSLRQGAREVHQFEILPKPPENENPETPWPDWPRVLRTSSSHEEGCKRRWSVLTKEFTNVDGKVSELHGVEIEWDKGADGRYSMSEVPGTEFRMKVDLVLLAMGFVHVEHEGLIDSLGVELDARGNIVVDSHQASEEGIFAAGDTVLGASLVVRAINSGREAAQRVDGWLRQR
ncbi:MAG: glutamate synthase subunit beta [Planctomycetota bacterium]